MRFLTILFFLVIAYIGLYTAQYYQVKNIEPVLSKLIKYNIIVLPCYLIINIIITMTLNKGYKILGEMWSVTIIQISASIFSLIIVTLILFKSIPKPNVIIGLILTITGLFLVSYK